MLLSLTPGRSSSNEPFTIHLHESSHLFISYSEEHQLTGLLNKFCNQLIQATGETPAWFALAVNVHHAEILFSTIPTPALFHLYISNSKEEKNESSGLLFIRTIYKELQKRMKKTELACHPLIVICDNIFELVVINSTKTTGKKFIEILQNGPEVGIHCIMASEASYNNLLKQLMQFNPNHGAVQSLGAELIVSGEGLLFYKGKTEKQYEKFYP